MNLKRQSLHSRHRAERYRNIGGGAAFGRRSGVPGGLRAFRCALLLGDDPDKLGMLKALTPLAVNGMMEALRDAAKGYDRGTASDFFLEACQGSYVLGQVRGAIRREMRSADPRNLEQCEQAAFMATAFLITTEAKRFSRRLFSACMKAAEGGGKAALSHYLRAYRVAETAGMMPERSDAKAKFIEECEAQKAYSAGAKAVDDHGWDREAGPMRETFRKWAFAAEWEGKELKSLLEQQTEAS